MMLLRLAPILLCIPFKLARGGHHVALIYLILIIIFLISAADAVFIYRVYLLVFLIAWFRHIFRFETVSCLEGLYHAMCCLFHPVRIDVELWLFKLSTWNIMGPWLRSRIVVDWVEDDCVVIRLPERFHFFRCILKKIAFRLNYIC